MACLTMLVNIDITSFRQVLLWQRSYAGKPIILLFREDICTSHSQGCQISFQKAKAAEKMPKVASKIAIRSQTLK